MTTTVFLVRHGTHGRLGKILCGRMAGVSLSDEGRAQARAAAERLRAERIEALYTSPLERTRETAEPIGQALGVEPTVDQDLLEIDYGDWTGREMHTLINDKVWDRWNAERATARVPGGESMDEVRLRMRRWLDRARAAHPGGRVAAVSHADAIKALVAEVLGLSLDRHMNFEISPGSVSALVAGDWGTKMLSINEVGR